MQSKETKVLKLSKNVKKLLNKGDYAIEKVFQCNASR